jgi:hypothetical protein
MITSQQFYDAVKIISDYKSQIELGLFEKNSSDSKVIFVNIQNNITKKKFFSIRSYYSDVLNINLEWNDLKVMNLDSLKKIDYTKLRTYRGFGEKAEYKLKQLINNFSIKYQEVTQ